LYERIHTNQAATLRAARLIRPLLRNHAAFELTDRTWYAFEQSLYNTIESPALADQFAVLKQPATLLFGRLDGLLNITKLQALATAYPNVEVVPVLAGHEMDPAYSKKVALLLKQYLASA
jgi:hypothetical protein